MRNFLTKLIGLWTGVLLSLCSFYPSIERIAPSAANSVKEYVDQEKSLSAFKNNIHEIKRIISEKAFLYVDFELLFLGLIIILMSLTMRFLWTELKSWPSDTLEKSLRDEFVSELNTAARRKLRVFVNKKYNEWVNTDQTGKLYKAEETSVFFENAGWPTRWKLLKRNSIAELDPRSGSLRQHHAYDFCMYVYRSSENESPEIENSPFYFDETRQICSKFFDKWAIDMGNGKLIPWRLNDIFKSNKIDILMLIFFEKAQIDYKGKFDKGTGKRGLFSLAAIFYGKGLDGMFFRFLHFTRRLFRLILERVVRFLERVVKVLQSKDQEQK